MRDLGRGCIAEFLGTFALVFFGCGSIVLTHEAPPMTGPGNLLTVGLAHAAVLMVFVSACLYLSGSQFNPAVSIGVLIAGRQSVGRTAAFIATQLFAAACAAGALVTVLGRGLTDPVMLGATLGSMTIGGASQPMGALVLEGIMTFALMFVIFAAIVDKRATPAAGFYVGGTVLACILSFGPLTGASMNPARTFGPMLYHWEAHAPVLWVYLIGPTLGAGAAALLYRFVWAPTNNDDS